MVTRKTSTKTSKKVANRTSSKAAALAALQRTTAHSHRAAKEAERIAAGDLAQRLRATTILNPNEVSGEYDLGRFLVTSLGGEIRQITLEDLRHFQHHVRRVKGQFKGGIRAQAVIDLSNSADRERANQEIHHALLNSIQGQDLHFLTNAGPNSQKTRHNVKVRLLDFGAVVAASPNDPKKLGKLAATGSLQFDCDCERHRYWYRYIASIGRYALGRTETGFPKIRNPELSGVACKHVLRTMHVLLKDAVTHSKIANAILAAREVLDARQLKRERVSSAELREIGAAQVAKRKQSSQIRTSSERQQQAELRKAKAALRNQADTQANTQPAAQPQAKPQAPRRLSPKKIAHHAQALLDAGMITQDQYQAIVDGPQPYASQP